MRMIVLRAPMRLQQQVGRHLEEEVAEEEDAGAEAVDGFAPAQFVEHGELDEADVDAVDPGQHPEREDEGNDAPGDAAVCRVERAGRRAGRCVLRDFQGGHERTPWRVR